MSKPQVSNAADKVRDFAREIVANQEADPTDALLKRMRTLWDEGEDDLAIGVSDELERLGAQRAIALARREANQNPASKVHASPPGIGAQVIRRGPYGWTLPNGSQLNMATVADVEDAIARHKVRAMAHAGWVKFYATVKAKMIAAKVHSVGDLFSEPDLLKLSVANGVEEQATGSDDLPTAGGGGS